MGHLIDLGKLMAAAALVGAVAWLTVVQPEMERLHGQQVASLAIIAGAAAVGDTATLRVFAQYGVPLGPPGR